MDEKNIEELQKLIKKYTYYDSEGNPTVYIPKRVIQEKFDNAEVIGYYLMGHNCNIIDTYSINEMINKPAYNICDNYNINISEERKNEIIDNLGIIINYPEHCEAFNSNIMPWEVNFVYNYITNQKTGDTNNPKIKTIKK